MMRVTWQTHLFLAALLASRLCAAQNSPVANDDFFTVQKNQTTLLPVTSNDFDADGDSLTISILTNPSHGIATLSANAIAYARQPTVSPATTPFNT
jgi:hypothetical protein